MMERVRVGSFVVFVALALLIHVGGCVSPDSQFVGRWEFVPPVGASHQVQLPSKFDSELPASPCRYQLRATVHLAPQLVGQPIALVIDELAGPGRLFVNGELSIAVDRPPWEDYRVNGSQRFLIGPAVTRLETLELELEIEHNWERSGWLPSVPRLVPGTEDLRYAAFSSFNRISALAALVVLAITSLLYLMFAYRERESRMAYLMMAAQAGFGGYIPLFLFGPTQVFGTYDLPLMLITTALAVVTSIHFIHLRLETRTPWRGCLALLIGAVAYSVALCDPFTASRRMVWGVAATVLGSAIYHVIVIGRARRRRPIPAPVAATRVGWVLLIMLGSNDILGYSGHSDLTIPFYPCALGVGLYGLIAVIGVALEYLHSLENSRRLVKHTDQLNAELETKVVALEARNRDVSALYDEVRHQISSRSRQLGHVLATLDTRRGAHSGEKPPGTMIGERYRVVRQLGAGGMATVYEVERISDGTRCAAKVIRGTDAHMLSRFAREADLICTIDDPHVVGIVDFDVTTAGELYLVMVLVPGSSLSELRNRFGDPAWALPLIAQLARALRAVHAHKVVHRDVKPANIMVNGDQLTLVDFGVGAASTEPGRNEISSDAPYNNSSETLTLNLPPPIVTPELTHTGFIIGTPRYMAPEAAEGTSNMSDGSDMFSFGLVAYEMLTGKRAYELSFTARDSRVQPRPGDLAELCPTLPPAICGILQSCLQLDVGSRPRAEEVVAVFDRAGLMATPVLARVTS